MNVEVRPIKTAAETALATNFAMAKRALPGAPAVAALREDAFRRFESEGLPHRRVEEWKYTDLRALMRDAKPLAGVPDAAAKARAKQAMDMLAAIEARAIVFVDGAFVPELSDLADLEAGLTIGSMAQRLAAGDQQLVAHLGKLVPTDDVAVALNTAFMGDGAVIHVAEGVALARPIHLIFVNAGKEPASIFVRSLVVIEKGARAMLVESHVGAECPRGPGECGARAQGRRRGACRSRQDHRPGRGRPACLQPDGDDRRACPLQRVPVHDRRRGGPKPAVRSVRRGGHHCRDPRREPAQGPPAYRHHIGRRPRRSRLHQPRGVQVGARRRKPRASSRARSSCGGTRRRPTPRMATHALLLSDTAEADNKPELEIFADDVQCGHGATSGDLDEDLLFYLKARGIPAKEAEALLIQAFVGEAVEGIEHAGLRDALMDQVVAWLAART